MKDKIIIKNLILQRFCMGDIDEEESLKDIFDFIEPQIKHTYSIDEMKNIIHKNDYRFKEIHEQKKV